MTVKMSRSKILILFCVSFYFLEIGIADVLKNDEEQQLLGELIIFNVFFMYKFVYFYFILFYSMFLRCFFVDFGVLCFVS